MDVIGGRYEVIERLGQGAMGVVYRAYDPVLDRQVAIKKMAAEIGGDQQLRQRFSQEARAAGKLNHKNIVTIYELDDRQGEISIVMELLEGVDLATLIRRRAVLPVEARLNIMAQVCDGLDFAHRAGIVHRDIKPANLHVSPSGHVKIVDFGIARLASSQMTNTGNLIGTPDYMSPEQVMAGKIDGRSDLFAVGVVLYELLSGSKPFEAKSVTAVLMKIVRDPHTPLRERAPQLPPALIDVVERTLAKNAADRPQTAQEVREALVSFAAGERAVLDPGTISAISTVVTTETLRPPSAVQQSGPAKSSGPRSSVASSSNDSQLASLAIEHGRALRNSGDLAGAMRVFRSVLESSPGNKEALEEFAALEGAIVQITSATEIAAPPVTTPPAAAATPSRVSRPVVAAALVLACFVLAFIVVTVAAPWLRSRPSVATPAPSAASAVDPAPPTPVPEPALPPTIADVARPAPPPSPTVARPAPGQVPAVASAVPAVVSAVPAVAGTVPVAAPPANPEPAARSPLPSDSRSVMVKHLHGFSFFRRRSNSAALDVGRNSCEGILEFGLRGFHFRTTTSEDRRLEDEDLPFTNIKGFEMERDKIRVMTGERNWDFLGSPDVLAQIEGHLKSGKLVK